MAPAAPNAAVLAERLDSLSRGVAGLEDDLKSGLADISRRLDGLAFVHPETLDTKLMLEAAHRQDLERRVGALEATNQWLWRTLAGLVLTLVLGGLVAASGFPT